MACKPYPVPDAPFQVISALHATERYLYIASRDRVYRVQIDSRRSQLLHQGEPLHDGTALAAAGDDLYVLDRSPAKLFRLSLSRPGELSELPIPPELLLSGDAEMASDGRFVYLVLPETRRIIEINSARARLLPLDTPESPRQVVGDLATTRGGEPRAKPSPGAPPSRWALRKPPALSRPTHIAAHRGIVYVFDDEAQTIVAFGRTDPRPLPLLLDGRATYDLTALAVARQGIFVRYGDGEVRAYRRLVPVDVTLDTTRQSEVATQIYEYLKDKRLLATRRVPIEGSFAATLNVQGVLPKGYVKEFTALACELNVGEPCVIKGLVPAGTQVLVPDVYSERIIDVREVNVSGRSVGEIVDAAIQTPELKGWAQEDVLLRFNKGQPRPPSLRARNSGTFQLPSEYVRFLIPMPADEVPPNPSALLTIRKKTPGVTFYSHESVYSVRAEATQSPDEGSDCDALRRSYEQMLATIHYPDSDPNVSVPEVTIGVAEDDIDRDHWDWHTSDAFITPLEPQVLLAADPATAEPYCRSRAFDPGRDHGTAVAALIGARRTKFGAKGLASAAVLFPMPRDGGSIAAHIERAFIDNDVRTISMSLTYEYPGPAQLLAQMRRRQGTVLFVIAAGNDHSREAQLCGADLRYPVCWGNELENVLIVTGTTLDGTSLPPYANRNDDSTAYVEIAAPAEGYFAAGQGNAYVPVAGTSFATPLVAATAALLSAQTNATPRLIKQRLLATTDLLPETVAASVGAGLLNVDRALRDPRHAVIVQGGTFTAIEPLQSDDIRVTLASGETKMIRLSRIRRLQKYEGAYRYRIAYVDEGDPGKLLWQSPVSFTRPADSRFRYRLVGTGQLVNGDLTMLTDFVGPMR